MTLPTVLRWLLMAGVCLALSVAAILGLRSAIWPGGDRSNASMEDARRAFDRGNYTAVLERVSAVDRGDAEWGASRVLGGRAAEQLGRIETAIEYFRDCPGDGSAESVEAAFALGELYRQTGRIQLAEKSLRYVVMTEPLHSDANASLGYLMAVTGRRWEARRYLMQLLATERWTLKSLCLMSDPEQSAEHAEYLRFCIEQDENDPVALLGMAVDSHSMGNVDLARQWLERSLRQDSEFVPALALLGELLVASEAGEYVDWDQALPAGAEESADIWYARGLRARRERQLKIAARCFWKSLSREPVHRRACFQLAQVLEALEHPGAGEFYAQAEILASISDAVAKIWNTDEEKAQSFLRIVQLLDRTQRTDEAWAWALTCSASEATDWADSEAKRLRAVLDRESRSPSDSVAEMTVLTSRYDLSSWPNHAVLIEELSRVQSAGQVAGRTSVIRFADTHDHGIDSVYFPGREDTSGGVRLFETNGGGVAVSDLDNDNWPDLYFTQGAEWKMGAQEPVEAKRYRDRMFRNRQGVYVDVTEVSGIECLGYGQGCTSGDVDNDGFADLYVANIGQNRLLRNNGDGTYTDVTVEAGIVGAEWTASVVIVDLNSDGVPDLFDVNYVTGDDVYTRICVAGSCGPQGFEGVPDTVQIGAGDGTFRHIPDATPVRDAKGMSVVAAAVFRPDRPDLLVANDQAANHFLRNLSADNPENLRLVDEGPGTGLAFNDAGVPTGSMGIAADDVDGNGLLDFFVTNFVDESNTLYLQDVPGIFSDNTRVASLDSASRPYVGWGTALTDADCDGDPDLVVVNGHVADYQIAERGYRMRPQLFENTGRGIFEELRAETAGAWFGEEFLSRGLASLDFDQDGRMDLAVSHIQQPASLVRNTTETGGRFLKVRLVARTGARDAFCSVVHVQAEGRRWTKQLTAGHGFMSASERVLHFGLADATTVDVEVAWSTGLTSVLNQVPADSTLTVVEGLPFADVLGQDDPAGLHGMSVLIRQVE
jgi:tetratricopeptide (TPR) repeat protein